MFVRTEYGIDIRDDFFEMKANTLISNLLTLFFGYATLRLAIETMKDREERNKPLVWGILSGPLTRLYLENSSNNPAYLVNVKVKCGEFNDEKTFRIIYPYSFRKGEHLGPSKFVSIPNEWYGDVESISVEYELEYYDKIKDGKKYEWKDTVQYEFPDYYLKQREEKTQKKNN